MESALMNCLSEARTADGISRKVVWSRRAVFAEAPLVLWCDWHGCRCSEAIGERLTIHAQYAQIAADSHHRKAHAEIALCVCVGWGKYASGLACLACGCVHFRDGGLHFRVIRLAKSSVCCGEVTRAHKYRIHTIDCRDFRDGGNASACLDLHDNADLLVDQLKIIGH
jgi:hypothetical protein